jgi:TatD DNase family protein
MGAYTADLHDVLARASSNGVGTVITIGIDLPSSKQAITLAARNPMVKATIGIHPHDVGNIDSRDLLEIEGLIENKPRDIVGYGEIGLDYVKRYSPAEVQRRAFADQLVIAKNHNLPVIVHDREAHDDILKVLRTHGPFDSGGGMHCFSGDLQFAEKVLDLGFHISIPGIVTFKNASALQEVAAKIPLEALLLETDGPFLAPDPYRGKRNEPSFLLYTAEKVATLRGISIDQLAAATTANAAGLFHLTIPSESTS